MFVKLYSKWIEEIWEINSLLQNQAIILIYKLPSYLKITFFGEFGYIMFFKVLGKYCVFKHFFSICFHRIVGI